METNPIVPKRRAGRKATRKRADFLNSKLIDATRGSLERRLNEVRTGSQLLRAINECFNLYETKPPWLRQIDRYLIVDALRDMIAGAREEQELLKMLQSSQEDK